MTNLHRVISNQVSLVGYLMPGVVACRARAQVDTSGLTLKEGLFHNFDDIIRRQLDAVWHTVSPRTKQARPNGAVSR